MKASFVGLLGLFGLVLATPACGPGNSTSDAGGVPDSGSATPDSGSGTNDSESIAPDTGSGMHDSGSDSTEYPLNVRITNDCGFVACGGNVVGDWRLQELCLPPQDSPSCPGLTLTATGTTRGHITITSTDIVEHMTMMTIRWTMTIPMSCLGGTTCDMAQNSLRMRDPEATCTAIGTDCRCTVSETVRSMYNSSYSISGNSIIGETVTYDYCVRGGRFQLRRADGTGPVMTLIPR